MDKKEKKSVVRILIGGILTLLPPMVFDHSAPLGVRIICMCVSSIGIVIILSGIDDLTKRK